MNYILNKFFSSNQIINFKKNRRGYYSLIIFLALFGFSLMAELFFNDKPLIINFNGEYFLPFLISYPETVFGGIFETETNYRDPYIKEQINKQGWIIWAPFPYSYDTIIKDIGEDVPAPPSKKNWLGVDDQARDVFARIVYGFRLSVFFGVLLSTISLFLGILAGVIQGYFGGWIDITCQRLLEIWDSVPILYLLIILTNVIKPNFWWLLLIMGLFSWMGYVGLVRAEVLRTRNFDYVRSAKALGASDFRIMIKHILPNALVSSITFLPFNLSGSISILASLDFLGLGLPAPTPSLGELIYQGQKNLHAPWLGLSGFIALAVLLSLLIFIGEAIRDSLDPQKVNYQ